MKGFYFGGMDPQVS